MYTEEGEDEYSDLREEEQLMLALLNDDKDKFVSLLSNGLAVEDPDARSYYILRLCEVFCDVFENHSLQCAAALLNGDIVDLETLGIDINFPKGRMGMLPLHCAASASCPPVTELFIFHKARTDIRCLTFNLHNCWKLPLNMALQRLRNYPEVIEWKWTRDQSIFNLIIILCLPRMQNTLENIGLLAWHTQETEEEFLRYARKGKIVELAALLMVARKKLSDPTLTKYITESGTFMAMLGIKKQVRPSVLHLLEVFQKAGDAIEAYVKLDKTDVSRNQAMAETIFLLQQAGFPLKQQDTDFSNREWFQYEKASEKNGNILECTPLPRDICMPHYSFSGHRWTGFEDSKMKELLTGKVSWEKVSVPDDRQRFYIPIPRSRFGMHFINSGNAILTQLSKFPIRTEVEAAKIVDGVGRYSPNVSSSKPWGLFASVMKRVLKHI